MCLLFYINHAFNPKVTKDTTKILAAWKRGAMFVWAVGLALVDGDAPPAASVLEVSVRSRNQYEAAYGTLIVEFCP